MIPRTISGRAIRKYGDWDIENISSWTPKSIYQKATAIRSEIAKPVSFPCYTLIFERGRVINVRKKHESDSTNFLASSAL